MSDGYTRPRLYSRPVWIVRHPRMWLRCVRNWWHGFAFQPIQRCRRCGHTAYTLPHCATNNGEDKGEQG